MHEGHRRRMINKLMDKADSLSEHEILEIMLYYCIPRINVNEIAHALLNSFGNLYNVLNSDVTTLCNVPGVGMKTAEYFSAVREFYKRVQKSEYSKISLLNFESCKPVLKLAFKNIESEAFVALYLDKSGNLLFKKTFCSHSIANVNINLSELVKGLNFERIESVIVAHNHLSGNETPSFSDDKATIQIFECLGKINVKLSDHIIVCENNFFSYRTSGRLFELIKDDCETI